MCSSPCIDIQPPGPLWAGPLWAPCALTGRASMSSCGLGHLWAGPYGAPWALMGRALMGQALMEPPRPLLARPLSVVLLLLRPVSAPPTATQTLRCRWQGGARLWAKGVLLAPLHFFAPTAAPTPNPLCSCCCRSGSAPRRATNAAV